LTDPIRPVDLEDSDPGQTLEYVLGVLGRRRRWIVGVAGLTALATIGVLLYLPNSYQSEAMLLVVQQQVPERYVTSTSTAELSEALEAMKQEVLARGRLLAMIEELNLYPKDRTRLAPEQLVARMRDDIEIEPLQNSLGGARKDVNAFKISFIASTPQLAQTVTSRLTASFIEQNLRSRSDQAATTTRFLREQLDAAKQRLTEQEQRVKEYKLQNLGELPEQQQGNLGILTGLQSQLQGVMASLNRAEQQRSYLESLIAEYKRIGARRLPSSLGGVPDLPLTPLEQAQKDLARLKAEKQRLLSMYTPQHPDVLKKDREVAEQQRQVDSLAVAATPGDKIAQASPPADAAASASSTENAAITAQLKSQLEANRLEIQNLKASEQKLKTDIGHYQGRLDLTPVREQQLSSIMRDYEISKQNYADLLGKEMQSQLASSLEKRQEGQQFRLADAPNLPSVPFKPKRLKSSLLGIVGGLALGLAIAFLLEFQNPRFYSDKQVANALGVPLVVTIPVELTKGEKRKRTWISALELCSSTVLLLAIVVAEYYVYRHG
jgi:polysaccharide biosynthesis transport protein